MATGDPKPKPDPDDDVVFMDAETAEQSLASKMPSLEAITQAITLAKTQAEINEKEIQLINMELNNLQVSECSEELTDEILSSLNMMMKDPTSMVSCDLTEQQLEEMITQVLESIPPEEFDIDQEQYESINKRLDDLDQENQYISKVFLDCHLKLKEFRSLQADELASLDQQLAKYGETAESFHKSAAPTRKPITTTASNTHPQQHPGPRKGAQAPAPTQNQTSPMALLNKQIQQQNSVLAQSMQPNIASTISHSMPALVSSLQQQQAPANQRPFLPAQPLSSGFHQPIHWPELKTHDKVLGKKFNDVWYSGTIMDIVPPDSASGWEWRYRVKFDGKGMKLLPSRQVAYRDPINCFIRVGTRVVALYREDDAPNTFYAGVIAEAPSLKNNRRFLVFFDDGYAQYCDARELHKVYKQSDNVWEDINPETSSFIKEYMRIYPERPMVRLSKGQVVRTEWNGKWWTSKVVETDASLVKMYFQADKRTEWIYRGSTRLEPLFKALANADAIKAAGSSKGRRHNLTPRPFAVGQQKPSVEYTRGQGYEDASSQSQATPGASSQFASSKSPPSAKAASSTSSQPVPGKKKSHNVARKSTTSSASASASNSGSMNVGDPYKHQKKILSSKPDTSEKAHQKGKSSRDIASVLQERLSNNRVEYDGDLATGERREIKLEPKPRKTFKPHTCSKDCLDGVDDPSKMKGRNALLIPLLYGWERQVSKARPATKRIVTYVAPCGRRLRNVQETDKYLMITDSLLTIDLFSFDQHLHVNTEFVPIKTFCNIKDLSYGRENYPISCVNGVDRHYPDYVEYSDHRIPSKKVKLNLDPNFLVCCDCTDNCRDSSKCACQQLTIENTSCIGEKDPNAGYHYRRLKEPLFTGIVECNSQCKCDKRCANRVAQHGLSMRLQVFKTEKKGWGLRCLDDIAKGSFICIYAGQLLTDREANEDGKQYGDQYLAELDFMEVVERQKEGYESDAEDIPFSDDEKDANYKASKDSEDSDYGYSGKLPPESERSLRKRSNKTDESEKPKESEKPDESVEKEKKAESSNQGSSDVLDDDEEDDTKDSAKPKPRAKKSTGGSKLNPSMPFRSSQEPLPEKEDKGEKIQRQPTRSFFEDNTDCYIMDAKSMGNLGRYLNHSCNPNVFVQNIFVDTHDLRFPWVTFWAGQYIRAGTELTWDYNYEVGSVPDRVLYCYCQSPVCRGRLL